MSETADDAFDAAEQRLSRIEERLGDLADGDGDLGELGADGLADVLEDVGALVEVADETRELLETVDVSELPDAVDGEELLEAIETGEIPDALADGDADDVVKVRKLIRAVNLAQLWDATDLRQFWTEKSELEDAIDDVTGEGADGGADEQGVVGDAVDGATDLATGDDGGSEGVVGETIEAVTGGEDEDGLLEEVTDELEAGATEAFGSAEGALEDGNLSEYQVLVQSAAMEGIEEFREALLLTHEKFQRLYEYNRERMRRTDRGTNSRNPTAVSTMPVDRAAAGGAERTTTVPQRVRYSTAPPMKRIYGRRFERELEKRRGELEEQRAERGTRGETDG